MSYGKFHNRQYYDLVSCPHAGENAGGVVDNVIRRSPPSIFGNCYIAPKNHVHALAVMPDITNAFIREIVARLPVKICRFQPTPVRHEGQD